jgi:hypothetical protein
MSSDSKPSKKNPSANLSPTAYVILAHPARSTGWYLVVIVEELPFFNLKQYKIDISR